MERTKKQLTRVKNRLRMWFNRKDIPVLLITVLFLIILVLIPFIASKKINLFGQASSINSLYPSGGTLGGTVSVVTDPTAPGGNYVRLGTIPTPTPTGSGSAVAQMVSNTKEIDYYPAYGGWVYTWQNFNPTVMNADFDKIENLGFNTVRFTLQADTGSFDYPLPTNTELNNLSQAITLAANHNIKVQLTLFDVISIQFTDIPGSEEWANAIVKPYARDPRISMIEVRNEVPPSNATVMSWLETMIPYVKSIDGGIPVTVSVADGLSNIQSLYTQLETAGTPPDFWDYHYYEFYDLAYSQLSQVKTIVNNQPLFIGETGYTTYAGSSTQHFSNVPQNSAAEEASQELFFRQVAYATKALNIPMASPFYYIDLTPAAIPPGGNNEGPTLNYWGIYRSDGSSKPAATTFQSINTGTIDTSFNNGFEQSDGQGLPLDWEIWESTAAGYTANFAWDDTVAHSGTASASLSDSTATTAGTAAFYIRPVQYIIPGQQYTFSSWAKGLNVTGSNNISIAWFDSNNNYISSAFSANLPTGTSNWVQGTVTATAPANAAVAELHLNSKGNSGTVWFDDTVFTAP